MKELYSRLKSRGLVDIIHHKKQVAVYDSMLNRVYVDLYKEESEISSILDYVSKEFQVPRDELDVQEHPL